MSKNERFFLLLGSSVLWGALVVPSTTAGMLAVIGAHTAHFGEEFGALLPWVFLFTAVPAVLLSTFGGFWLGAVGATCVNWYRLAGHGLLAGAVLSLPFSVFGLIGSATGGAGSVWRFLLTSTVIGAANGLAYALVFQRLFLRSIVAD